MPLCACPPDALCALCYGRELLAKGGQARVVGQCWAERTARRPEYRGRASWPDDERTQAIALRLVAQLSPDPKLRVELAKACGAGAAAWWERRPERYRDWSLVTAPDELERCCVVVDGQRCAQPAAFEVRGAGPDDYTYTCADHVALVRRPGDRVSPVGRVV